VFSTVFELRGVDLLFFSCAAKNVFEKKWGDIQKKNVLLLKFDGLEMHFYGIWSHFEALYIFLKEGLFGEKEGQGTLF
jgi:hypothetical protein